MAPEKSIKVIKHTPHRMLRGRPFLMLMTGCVFLLLMLVFYNYGKTILINNNPPFYGIMFDAGSTGTRIHAFKFIKEADNMEMVDELFSEVKPGISAYASKPKDSTKDIKGLLDKAKQYIPPSQWPDTFVALKATAGLRMLEETQADGILNEIRAELEGSLFKPVPNGVNIMEGSDEGIYSWYTVNFYLHYLNNMEKTEAVMDLGGGSTQITSSADEQMGSKYSEYIEPVSVHGSTVNVYTRSYLGLGLMVARLNMFGGLQRKDTELSFNSPCLFKDEKAKFFFGGNEYEITGTSSETSTYDACINVSKAVVLDGHIEMPSSIREKQVTLISYYFDRAKELNLIELGGQISVEDFITATKNVCSNKNRQEPLLCADASYITTLLTEGFGFDTKKIFNIRKNVNGQEISWALGAMVNIIEKQGGTQSTKVVMSNSR